MNPTELRIGYVFFVKKEIQLVVPENTALVLHHGAKFLNTALICTVWSAKVFLVSNGVYSVLLTALVESAAISSGGLSDGCGRVLSISGRFLGSSELYHRTQICF